MRVNRNLINVVIVLAIAAIVAVVPGGGWGANFVLQVIAIAFLASFAWIASRLYREHRVALYSLGNQRRAILYGAVGVAIVTFAAWNRLTSTGGGSVALIVLLGACGVAIYRVYRSTRTY
jgi:hypothetical protein